MKILQIIKKKRKIKTVKSGNAEDGIFNEECLLSNNCSGYGNGCKPACFEKMGKLKKNDIKVTYAIHPVAGGCQAYERSFSRSKCSYDEVLN